MLSTRSALCLSVIVILALVVVAQPRSTLGQISADESFQPIVVSGAAADPFLGAPVSELFVFAYRDSDWSQIPFQIDEKVTNEDGVRVYAFEGDGQLDVDEELVFMLKDMGEKAPASTWADGAVEDYRLELAATAGDGSRHYAYVFHGSELTRTFTADYVRFSGAAQRIIAERYEVGFLDNGAGLDELRLNNSGVDILDRTKVRLHVVVFGVLHRLVTEDDLEGAGFAPVKDGPVRLIRGERGGFAYGALFQERNEVDLSDLSIPGARIERVRFSWDFNAEVLDVATPTATTSLEASLSGGVATPTLTTYLDANLSEPVIIDGQPDEVPAEPVPAWRQVSHATGTIVFIADLSSLGGTQRNYYKDDGSLDSGDTGDGRSYGDAGFEVEDPNTSFSLDTKLLVLPPTFEDVGKAYADALATPPAVMAEWQLAPGWLGRKVHLPLVRR